MKIQVRARNHYHGFLFSAAPSAQTDLLEANWLNGLPVLPAFLFLLLLSVILLILSAGITVKIFNEKN
ncbi:MAG: hypothetical protein ACLVAW_19260 [Eisenbergiella massiliensis]